MEAAIPETSQQSPAEQQPIATEEKAVEPVVENPAQKEEAASAAAGPSISNADGSISPSSRVGNNCFRCSYRK